MKQSFKKQSLVLAAGLCSAFSMPAAQACSVEPFIGSVCIMAMPDGRFNSMTGFVLARGQLMQITQNQALYSLVGTTWGGDGRTTFGIPNLAGRVVVGSGLAASGQQYVAGASDVRGRGGVETTTLTIAQLPMHNHTLTGGTVDISKMTATTTLSGLTTTTNLAGVSFSAPGSTLTLNASSAQGSSNSPSPANSAFLSSTSGGQAKLYGTTAPDTAMNSGSITGTVSGTLSGNAPGTVSGGTATTTLGGTASVVATTALAGSSGPVSLMQPYLVMNYYVATTGIYPSSD
jgi:microcystin-dependent protein